MLSGGTTDANHGVAIAEITEVAKPEIGSAPEGVPTYVAGKCLALTERDRQGNIKYAKYSFSPVSSGYLVFDADIFGDGNYPTYVRFVDGDGNPILTMHWKDGNTDASRAFMYQVGTGEEVSTSLGGKPRTYHGYGIRDLVVNFETGATSFKLDYITFAGVRALSNAVELNIGTGKNIAGIQLGYVFNSGSTNYTQHSYMDNIKLYSVGIETPSYTYTIKAKAGSTDLTTLATGTCKGGMSFSTTGIPQVIQNGEDFYVLTDAGVSNFMISYDMENDGSNKDQTIEYTLDNTIIYYGEIENLSNHGGITEGNFSNGANAPISGAKYSALAELSAGVYSVTAAVNDRPDRGMIIRSNQSTNEAYILSYVTTATSGIMTGEFSLYGTTTIYLSGITTDKGVNQSATMDYIIIRKTGDITAIPGTIAASGYSSLATNFGLDFTNATGIDAAYVVTEITNTTVTISSVDEITAGQAVILKGTGSAAYSIPVKADATFVGTNLLKAAVTATDIAANEAYILQNGEFHLVTAASTIPAGKAYLLADDIPSGARSLNFTFDATAIKAVEGEIQNGEFYNVAGQRVAVPTKGLYIVNGKKIVVK